jgi:predicted 3-demethylubiquinone-9 3-methyltransferase (glyoxalase superfamily)
MATMPKTAPCLWFNGDAEEAASFYCSVFPNSRINRVVRYPENNPFPTSFPPGTALTVDFELDGTAHTALNGGPEFSFTEAISLQVFCKDQDEVDRYWEALSEGGEEGPCGWLKDRYGLSWQVVPLRLLELVDYEQPAKTQAVMAALAEMTKLDVAALEAAYAAA